MNEARTTMIRPRPGALLAALWPLLLVPACTLDIDKPWVHGVDPCDPNPCTESGACAGWAGSCKVSADSRGYTCSDWKPVGDAPLDKEGKPLSRPEAFESVETTCDGLDNDCDGLTDEGVIGEPASDCPTEGVCAAGPSAMACVSGAWRCEYAAVAAFEASETTCDGLDNDCDGQTDETVRPGYHDCRRAGVCADLAPPTCTAGKWDCHYDLAAGFEQAEKSCDGLDNDCDGQVDAGLSLASLPDGTGCHHKGVCAAGVSVVCVDGKATCRFDAVSGWEAIETTCDGKDNDCDGRTDNLAGSPLPLSSADTEGCRTGGVCKTAATSIHKTCEGGHFVCDYTAVPYHEATETLCDGRDNDCDGAVDAGLPQPAKSPCGERGVCAQGAAVCTGGAWLCDYAKLAEAGYQAAESRCDGLDNDCDGKTDEEPSPAGSGCPTAGVCAFGMALNCKAGNKSCDPTAVPYHEATETRCDGRDNDCDGLTDEGKLDASDSGCLLGVCQGRAVPICTGGVWKCDVSKVQGYQQQELACDGRDNDCDGLTDEPEQLDLSASATACELVLGVCGTDKKLSCVAGKAVCSYGAAYEKKETRCDGKDNDCDGQTDRKRCVQGQPCAADSYCDKGSCATVRGGTGKQCTAKPGQCAALNSAGKVAYTDSLASVCQGAGSRLTCHSGTWSKATACPKGTPACYEGSCKLCVPDGKTCDPNHPADVVQCDASGSKATRLKTCATGRCVGAGLCVVKGEFEVTDLEKLVGDIAVTAVSTGGFLVAWISEESPRVVRARAYDAQGRPHPAKKASFVVNAAADTPASGGFVAAARSGSFHAVAWPSAGNVVVQVFEPQQHAKYGDKVVLSAAKTTDAGRVALAAPGDGFLVAWQANGDGGVNAGIWMARISPAGKQLTAPTLVNAGAEDFDEIQPAVAVAEDGSFVVVWAVDASFGGTIQLAGRAFDSNAKPTTGPLTLLERGDLPQFPAVALVGKTLVAAWAEGAQDTEDLQIATFDASLKLSLGARAAMSKAAGAQNRPAFARTGTKLRLCFESAGLASGSGKDIAIRTVDGGLHFDGPETLATATGAGKQERGQVVIFADGRELLVWRHYDALKAVHRVRALFR